MATVLAFVAPGDGGEEEQETQPEREGRSRDDRVSPQEAMRSSSRREGKMGAVIAPMSLSADLGEGAAGRPAGAPEASEVRSHPVGQVSEQQRTRDVNPATLELFAVPVEGGDPLMYGICDMVRQRMGAYSIQGHRLGEKELVHMILADIKKGRLQGKTPARVPDESGVIL